MPNPNENRSTTILQRIRGGGTGGGRRLPHQYKCPDLVNGPNGGLPNSAPDARMHAKKFSLRFGGSGFV